jgi:hypothetical protein
MALIGLRILEMDDKKNETEMLEVFSHQNPDLVKIRFCKRTITVDLRLLHLTIQHLASTRRISELDEFIWPDQ